MVRIAVTITEEDARSLEDLAQLHDGNRSIAVRRLIRAAVAEKGPPDMSVERPVCAEERIEFSTETVSAPVEMEAA